MDKTTLCQVPSDWALTHTVESCEGKGWCALFCHASSLASTGNSASSCRHSSGSNHRQRFEPTARAMNVPCTPPIRGPSPLLSGRNLKTLQTNFRWICHLPHPRLTKQNFSPHFCFLHCSQFFYCVCLCWQYWWGRLDDGDADLTQILASQCPWSGDAL